MKNGDNNGRKHNKAGAPRIGRNHRPPPDAGGARHDLCAGMLGHAGAGYNERMYGGILRTLRIPAFPVQRKDKIQ